MEKQEFLILGEVSRMGSATLIPWTPGGQIRLLKRLGSSQKERYWDAGLSRKEQQG